MSDGQPCADPELRQAELNQSIAVLYLARRAHFYYYCSSEELYVLSHSYSNENKVFDRGRLAQVLLLNSFSAKKHVFNSAVMDSSLTESR